MSVKVVPRDVQLVRLASESSFRDVEEARGPPGKKKKMVMIPLLAVVVVVLGVTVALAVVGETEIRLIAGVNFLAWILMGIEVVQGQRREENLKKAAGDLQDTSSRLRRKSDHFEFERQVLDHRFGNSIRMARLLLDEKKYGPFESMLASWELEVNVRQQRLDHLPLDPIPPTRLFSTTFTFPHTITSYAGNDRPLYFYNARKERVPYAILQVAFFTDCASNIVKHGGAKAAVRILPDAIVIENAKVANPNLPASNKVGLRALDELGFKYGIPLRFSESETHFTVTLYVRSTLDDRPSSSESESETAAAATEASSEEKTSPQSIRTEYEYFLVEDSAATAKLTQQQYKKHGIDLRLIVEAHAVANIEAILMEAYYTHDKPLVVLFDENFLTLNSDFRIVTETGTNLRRKLTELQSTKHLLDKKQLFFFSCSASSVDVLDDPSLTAELGKAVNPTQQIGLLFNKLGEIHTAARKQGAGVEIIA